MSGVIQVERDAAGLQIAVRELFEETLFEESMRPLLAKVGDDPEMRERIYAEAPERTLSPGYYDRCAYLLDLGSAIEAGAVYSADTLQRSDVTGLLAVRAAKAAFERDHPSCPACGTRQDNRYMKQCKSCRCKLAGRGD
jgi:hypothetical protein